MNILIWHTWDQSDINQEPTALVKAKAHGPISQVAWCAGFSLCLHFVSSSDVHLTDLDLIPIPQATEH